jgi:transposase-like protein
LTGPDGLRQLTKMVLGETALDQEMTEHLDYEKDRPVIDETEQRPQRSVTPGGM